MQSLEQRLLSSMAQIRPLVGAPPRTDTQLKNMGFDSMTLIALFVDLQRDFALSVESMQRHLNMSCTFGTLLTLCAESSAHASDSVPAARVS